MSADNASYFALALALTALFALITFFVARSRGLPAWLKGIGITIVPIALWLTGTLRLASDIVDDVGYWASNLVFSPRTWSGLIVVAVAVVLIAAGTALRRRVGSPAPAGRAANRGAKTAAPTSPDQLPPTRARLPAKAATSGKGARSGGGDAELDDIEALLRRHGIS